jgi:hypothetical protein
MIKIPPTMAAGVSGELSGGGSNWSTSATMKMVRSAATEDRTGDVRDMRTRKDPLKAVGLLALEIWSEGKVSKGQG